jgi:hypothetical protein
MADKDTKTLLNTIVSSVTKNTDVSTDVQSDTKMILELVNTIYQRVEDMSKKFDDVLNVGLKKPKITPPKKTATSTDVPKKKKAVVKKEETKTEPKLIKNIMSYFKVKYIEDPTIFDNILEESQAEALFEEHADELADKKGVAKLKTQTSLLYKNLTKTQKKKIREKMLDENDAASVNNDDDIKCDDSD